MTWFLPVARGALAALALFLLPAGAGMARTVPVVPGQVIGQVEVPDDWTVSTTDRGLQLATPDEEVMMWMEVFKPGQGDAVMKEHEAYFTQQGVRVTGPSIDKESVTNGVRLVTHDLPATWNGARTMLAYQIYGAAAAPSQILMITYWASPEGDARYGAQVQALVSSTNFALR